MPADWNSADTLQSQPSTVYFEAVAILFESERRKAVLSLEPRIPRFLATLHSAEEISEGFI